MHTSKQKLAETPVTPTSEAVRFGKFALVGTLNTLIDFGLMNLFTAGFGWQLVPSQALSFAVAVINSYILNRKWVYPETTEKSIANQFSKFVIINIAGLTLRTVTISPLDRWFYSILENQQIKVGSLSSTILSHNLALIVVGVFILILNFLANRFWTFGDVPRSHTKKP